MSKRLTSYRIIFISLAGGFFLLLLNSCSYYDCGYSGEGYGNVYYGPKDMVFISSDSTAEIVSLCYPQVSNQCLHFQFPDTFTYGLLLRGFKESVIDIKLSDGRTEQIRLSYDVYPGLDCSGSGIAGFKNVRLVSSTLDSFNLSYTTVFIKKY